MLRSVFIILFALSLTQCAKEAVKDEPLTQKETAVENEKSDDKAMPDVTAQKSTTDISEENKRGSELKTAPITEPGKKETAVLQDVTEPTENSVSIGNAEQPEMMDSTEVFYMIRPNDYLVKIAINEYGRPTMWRKIWRWNYDMIGENPNLIYPYRELSLLKPVEYAVQTEFSYYDYTVKKDDTLWSIAKEEYGNNLAWIVILRDNYDAIAEDYNDLKEDTVLKLRTKLY